MDEFFSLLGAIGAGPAPDIVPKEELDNGVKVSTVDSYDMGPETALIGFCGTVVPVERYDTAEEAKEGHKKWIEKAKKGPYPMDLKDDYGEIHLDRTIHDKESAKKENESRG